jgi:hypothetical protein
LRTPYRHKRAIKSATVCFSSSEISAGVNVAGATVATPTSSKSIPPEKLGIGAPETSIGVLGQVNEIAT